MNSKLNEIQVIIKIEPKIRLILLVLSFFFKKRTIQSKDYNTIRFEKERDFKS